MPVNSEDWDRNLLWYDPSISKWVGLPFERFCRARGSWYAKAFGYPTEGEALIEARSGDHRFVVCVLDDELKTCLNFIAHRYIIDAAGYVDRFPTTLSEAEEAEYKQLDLKRCVSDADFTQDDKTRFERLHDQQWEVLRLSADLLQALKRDIPWSIKSGNHPSGGFWGQYQRHSGVVDRLGGSIRL